MGYASGSSGTRIVMYQVKLREYDLNSRAGDILVRTVPTSSWPHERSMRGFLEVLYYNDCDVRESMKMFIKGVEVTPRNWTDYLHLRRDYSYRPQGGADGDGSSAQATVSFGYQLPLADLVAAFQSRNGTVQNKDHKEKISHYKGVFYYHKHRLTLPLVMTSRQTKQLTQMLTTTVRVLELGWGLIGCCRENFLTQAHNKREYVAGPHGFKYEVLAAAVNKRLEMHLSQTVARE